VNPLRGCARRGGRCPGWAPTVAVGLAGRLRCDARAGVAPRNSLHSLRSLRSNNRGESEDEARAARAPTPALALQAASGFVARPLARHKQSTGLFVSGLAFSPPHKSPTPGTTHRAATLVLFDDACRGGAGKAVGGCATAATLCGAEERRARGRARAARASSSDSRRLFEHNDRREWSEFRRGPRDRAPQGSRPERADRRTRAPAHTRPRLCLARSLHAFVVNGLLRTARDC